MSTTLMLGQAGTFASELWKLEEDSYGNSVGEQGYLRMETQDFEPLPGGQASVRRIFAPLAYSGACTVRVTPIVDFHTALAPTTASFAHPQKRTRKVIEARAHKLCSYIRARIEVVSLAGRVELFTPRVGVLPVAEVADVVAGVEQ